MSALSTAHHGEVFYMARPIDCSAVSGAGRASAYRRGKEQQYRLTGRPPTWVTQLDDHEASLRQDTVSLLACQPHVPYPARHEAAADSGQIGGRKTLRPALDHTARRFSASAVHMGSARSLPETDTMNHNILPEPTRRNNSFPQNTVFNTSSDGASTAVGLTILAAEVLHAHHEDPTGDALEPMAQVLHTVLLQVQHKCATDISPVLSKQTDLMALLHSCLKQDPVPLDTYVADVAGIQEWMEHTTVRMLRMVRVSKGLALDALQGQENADPAYDLAHVVSGVDPSADDDV
jgi:hypothetical protein